MSNKPTELPPVFDPAAPSSSPTTGETAPPPGTAAHPGEGGRSARGRIAGPRTAFTHLLVVAALGVSVAAIAAGRRPSPGPTAPPSVPAQVTPTVTPPRPPAQAVSPRADRPRVELVFALDTTSSMAGLIEGAKRKIWSLASYVAQAQPTPDVRIGLVAFRDVGDDYVTRVFDLDDDLDRVYARLRGFRAEGGGDTPEHVARALDESVRKMSWTRKPGVVRIIYLVGDAPPHDDYQDGYDWGRAARAAVAADIAVHTIRCGVDTQTEAVWRKIASIGHGQFMTVQQDGGMRDVKTPYDDELARLHDELGGTAVAYGASAGRTRETMASAAAAPAPIKAERARFLAKKGRALGGAGDLIADAEAGVVDLNHAAPAGLPADMAALPPAALKAEVAKRSEARTTLHKRIDAVAAQREQFIERENAKATAAGEADGFDAAAKAALRESVKANRLSGLKL